MITTKLHIKALLFSLLLINNLVYSMEKKNTEIYQFDEHNLSPIETIPNELLLLIFYSQIDDLINTNNAHQGKEECKTFLSALRLTNRKFHSFGDELKRYFVIHKKLEVSDVTINMQNYYLSFKIGNFYFKSESGNDVIDIEFLDTIKNVKITEETLKIAGQEIAKKVTQSELAGIWGSIIDGIYEKATTSNEKDKIRAFIKPLLAFYKFNAAGNEKAGVYKSALTMYELEDSDIIKKLKGW